MLAYAENIVQQVINTVQRPGYLTCLHCHNMRVWCEVRRHVTGKYFNNNIQVYSDRDNVLMMVLISTMIIMMKVISLTSIMQPYITCHTPTLHCVSCIQIFSNLGRLVLVYQTSCQHHSQWALTSHSCDAGLQWAAQQCQDTFYLLTLNSISQFLVTLLSLQHCKT